MISIPASAAVAVNDASEDSPLLRLHDSLLQNIIGRTDIQSRVAASVACRRLARVSAEHPPSVVDLSSDGVHPEACRQYIERAKGAIITIVSAKHQQRTACAATSARRFRTGVRCTQVVPYTCGPYAARLAACLPSLQHLSLHEATSCLGGMTDELAAGVAAHCPGLTSLEVAFTRYSVPSEFFTDAGLMSLAAGCPRVSHLALTHCGAITDRSLYAVAVHWGRGLRSLELGGYHELISDYGTVVLFQACTSLERVVLSGKLRRVTDESGEALAAGSGGSLREVKLTRSMGDRSLAALAAHCRVLRRVDCSKCEPGAITAAGVATLIKALMAAAAAAPAGLPPTSGVSSGGDSSSGGGSRPNSTDDNVIRVLLPPGLAAADVVRLEPRPCGGSGGGGGDPAVRWREVVGHSSGSCSASGAAAAPGGPVARSGSGGGASSPSYYSPQSCSPPVSGISPVPMMRGAGGVTVVAAAEEAFGGSGGCVVAGGGWGGVGRRQEGMALHPISIRHRHQQQQQGAVRKSARDAARGGAAGIVEEVVVRLRRHSS